MTPTTMMTDMGLFTLLAIIALAAIVALVIAAIMRGRGGGSDEVLARSAQQQSELAGRLAQMAEQAAAAQNQTAERLQAQERTLAKVLEERLAALDKRLVEGLEKSTQTTSATITDVRERLVKIDEAQRSIAELSTHVVSLQDILSNKQARGAFGEEQLEAIVRDQLPPAHFAFQETLSNGTRVDCLIKLPPPLGPLGIDAKFPREAWDGLRAAGAEEGARAQAAKAFASAIAIHVKAIADKYVIPGETAEAALMFVPSEAVYAEIYASAGEVADQARRRRVFIVSPTTLWAVLNTMRAILKDARMREQAGRIQLEVEALLNDVRLLDERAEKLQKHFGQAEEDVRKLRTSAERIAQKGEKIRDVELAEDEEKKPLAPPATT